MKNRLIILSDLWGKEKSEWLIHYTEYLSSKFDIQFYDCCELAEVDKKEYTQETLHQQFVNGGIQKAVKRLIQLEKNSVSILAFSIGGTIAWQYGIRSGNIDSLTCVSSTRLRYESQKPSGRIKLFYGEDDDFRPSQKWLEQMNIGYTIVANKGHELYKEKNFILNWLNQSS